MPNELDPLVDQWYAYLDKGQRLCVTVFDKEAGVVGIQHFDGDIEEFSLQQWRELNIELSEEPENWSGALENTAQDDLGTGFTDTCSADCTEPQQNFRTTGQEQPSSEVTDDYGEGHISEEPLE